MKKLLLILTALLLIVIISAYIFIPSNLEISDVATAKTTMNGTYRTISSKSYWQKWWNYNNSEKKLIKTPHLLTEIIHTT